MRKGSAVHSEKHSQRKAMVLSVNTESEHQACAAFVGEQESEQGEQETSIES